MSTKFVPKHKGDKNPNPKLLKFVRHVTDRVPGKIKMTTDAPEYWGLACIFEDEMDAVTREASLDLLLDMLPGNFFKVREHHSSRSSEASRVTASISSSKMQARPQYSGASVVILIFPGTRSVT